MQVRMSNGLAGSRANVDADVVASRHIMRFDVSSHRGHESPDCNLLLQSQSKKVGLVSSRDHKAMPNAQRESVEERDGEVVGRHALSDDDAVTEDAIHVWHPGRE